MEDIVSRAEAYAHAYNAYPKVGPYLVTILAQIQIDALDSIVKPERSEGE